MQFTVTYRGADGAVMTEAVEAASRGACFAQMKARGITPMGVKEGASSRRGNANRGAGGGRDKARSPHGGGAPSSALPWILVALAFVLVGGGVWWWLASRGTSMEQGGGPKKPGALAKEVKPSAAPKPMPKAAETNVAVAAPTQNDPPPRKLTHEERIEMLEKKILENPPNMTVRSNRVFSTGLEQSLAAIFSTQLGAPPPMIPPKLSPVTLVHLERILDTPNEILDTDSDKVAEAKAACAAAKVAMKEYIDGGGDPEKFIEHYHSILKQANAEWKAAQFKLIETMKTDPGLAPIMEEEVNENFKARGMRPIQMPRGLKERYGIK